MATICLAVCQDQWGGQEAARQERIAPGASGNRPDRHQSSTPSGPLLFPRAQCRLCRGLVSIKPGFRDVLFTVEMQFSASDKDRGFEVSTQESGRIAYGRIPTTEPVALSIYLPPLDDAPDPIHPLKRMTSVSDIGRSNEAARFFNIETGKFSNSPDADLRFDLFFEEDSRFHDIQPRVRITGLNGTQLLQVSSDVALSGSLSPYEHVFRIAPESGYQDEIVLQNSGSRPGPTIYLRARGGQLYGRMNIEAWGRRDQTRARCEVWLYLNPTGRRQLEK